MSKTNDVIFETLLKQHELWLGKGNTKRTHLALRDLLVHLHGLASKAAAGCDDCACKASKDTVQDAELINRIKTAPERKVYEIDVGGLPQEKIQEHVDSVKEQFQMREAQNSDAAEQARELIGKMAPETVKEAVKEAIAAETKKAPRKK